MNSRQVQLTTDFGLTVQFDGNSRGGKIKTICPHITEKSFVPFLSNLSLPLYQILYCQVPIGIMSEDYVETMTASQEMSI